MFRNIKDKKIIIYEKKNVKNDKDFTVITWERLHTGKLWACYRSLSGSEHWQSIAENYAEEVIFTVNWRRDILPGMRIVFSGDVYEITYVDDLEGYKQDLKLSCKWLQGEKLDNYN